MHQLRIRPLKPFWGWTKPTSSLPNFYFIFSCLYSAPKHFSPTYLLPTYLLPTYLPPPTSHLLFLIAIARASHLLPLIAIIRVPFGTRAKKITIAKTEAVARAKRITNTGPTFKLQGKPSFSFFFLVVAQQRKRWIVVVIFFSFFCCSKKNKKATLPSSFFFLFFFRIAEGDGNKLAAIAFFFSFCQGATKKAMTAKLM